MLGLRQHDNKKLEHTHVLRRRDVMVGRVPMAILVLAMAAASPAAPRQQLSNLLAGSARAPPGHSMCTSDAWRHKDSMEHCSGDLQYSDE